MPRTQQDIVELPHTPRHHLDARGYVEKFQAAAHNAAATAAAVAAPVVLAGATVVAGGATGAALGAQLAGESAAQTLGEWSRGPAQAFGRLAGGVGGTSLTNTAMHVASSCQRRASPPRPRRTSSERFPTPRSRPKTYSIGSGSGSENGGSQVDERDGQINALRSELLKLRHLESSGQKEDSHTSKVQRMLSAERRMVERQDALGGRLLSMQ